MKKNSSPLSKINQNFKNLIPYIGVLFVMAGIVGLLFIQQPLKTSQDPRSEAYLNNEYTLKNCNETCTTNRDCAINLRCYEGMCRLATNPDSSSCSTIADTEAKTEVENEDKVTKTIDNTATNSASEPNENTDITNDSASNSAKMDNQDQINDSQNTDTPLQKGDNLLLDPDLEFKNQQNALADKKAYDASYQADETLLDLFKNLVLNSESQLPIFIILLGIILLILSITVALTTRLKRSKNNALQNPHELNKKINVKSYTVKPGKAPRNSATKDLLKTLENKPKN